MKERMSFNIGTIFYVGVPLSILLSNIKLVDVLGAKLQLSHVILIAAIICMFTYKPSMKQKNMVYFIFFSLYPLAVLYRVNDPLEFMKTYVIYFIMIVFAFFYLEKFQSITYIKYLIKLIRYFVFAMFLLQLYGILQFALVNLFGNDCLFNVFGRWQYLTQIKTVMWGIRRASSLFYEPSFFGVMCNTELAIIMVMENGKEMTKKQRIFFAFFAFVGILITLSASAFFTTFCLIVTYIFFNKKIKKKYKLLCILLGTLVFVAMIMSNSVILKVFARITDIGTENTSTYERLYVPMVLLKITLCYYPFLGRGLGQEGDVDLVGKFGLYNSPQNSIVALFVTFGLSIIPVLIFAWKKLWKHVKKNKMYLILLVDLFFSLLSNGGYLSLDFMSIYILLLSEAFLMDTKNVLEREDDNVSKNISDNVCI